VGRFVFAILHHGDERDLGEAILPAAEAPELGHRIDPQPARAAEA